MRGTRELLRTERLCKTFGSLMAVRDISLAIRQGEIHAIIGPNGAGKTTLLNVLSGELLPTSGSQFFADRDVTGWTPDRLARVGLGRSFQHSSIFEDLTTFENVRVAAQARLPTSMRFIRPARSYQEITQRAEKILGDLGLLPLAAALAGEISHGEQRLLEVAMLSAIAPKLMLLDEPTSGMSPAETARMIELIASLPRTLAILMIEHDMKVVFSVADRIAVLYYGEVLATGTPAEIQANARVREVYLGMAH